MLLAFPSSSAKLSGQNPPPPSLQDSTGRSPWSSLARGYRDRAAAPTGEAHVTDDDDNSDVPAVAVTRGKQEGQWEGAHGGSEGSGCVQ